MVLGTVRITLSKIPLMGIAGAALASSIAFTSAGVLWLIFYKRESKTPLREMVPRVEDVKCIFAGVIAMSRQVIILTNSKLKSAGNKYFRKK